MNGTRKKQDKTKVKACFLPTATLLINRYFKTLSLLMLARQLVLLMK
jgi:hypothetical protein